MNSNFKNMLPVIIEIQISHDTYLVIIENHIFVTFYLWCIFGKVKINALKFNVLFKVLRRSDDPNFQLPPIPTPLTPLFNCNRFQL